MNASISRSADMAHHEPFAVSAVSSYIGIADRSFQRQRSMQMGAGHDVRSASCSLWRRAAADEIFFAAFSFLSIPIQANPGDTMANVTDAAQLPERLPGSELVGNMTI